MSTSISSGTPPSDDILAALAARVLDDLTPEDLIVSAAPDKVGRYEVIEPLPSGSEEASSYLAQDPKLGRRVVLRVLEGQSLADCERFQREARSLARLDHPHLLEVYDAGVSGTRPYLVQAYSRGRTLAEVQPAASITLDTLIAAAQGLHAAHAEGIVHGAISPGMVQIEPHPRLLGLGLAGLGLTSALDRDYVAPEVLAGGSPTPQSDVYSLGAVLYEALSGYPPRQEEGAARVRPLSELRPELHPELAKVPARALERSPERRFASAEAFAKALSAHRRPPAPPPAAGTPALLPLVVLLLTLSLGLVLGIVLARGIRPEGAPTEREAQRLAPPVVPQQPHGADEGRGPPAPQQPFRPGNGDRALPDGIDGPQRGPARDGQWQGPQGFQGQGQGPGYRGQGQGPGYRGQGQGPGYRGQGYRGQGPGGWQGGPGQRGPGQPGGWRRGQGPPPQGGYPGRQGYPPRGQQGYPQGGPRGQQGEGGHPPRGQGGHPQGGPPPQNGREAPPHHRGQEWRRDPRDQQGRPPGERPPPPEREEEPAPEEEGS